MRKYCDKRGRIWWFPLLVNLACICVLICSGAALATISGPCSECHTMHNSQNNQAMTYNASATPNDVLLKGTCYGCHAQGAGAPSIVILGVDSIPQVYHDAATDLAGGNFAYIDGIKGSGASDGKGHNISDLTGTDADLYAPPGGIVQFGHDNGGNVNTNNLCCAGTNGCHGNRYGPTGYIGITGAHHTNLDGSRDPAATDKESGHSYRFLLGVKGYEDPDWQNTIGPADHNEYFGRTTPVQLGCGGGSLSCHGTGGVRPPDGTMSQYCATCHGNFHTLETNTSNGIGPAVVSPFIRHPTDLAIPNSGEYAAYVSYDQDAPVARTTAGPWAPNSTITPGSDAVMCLSCHVSHASNYLDMLRWDYSTMIAGGGGTGGCFVCHTTKN